MEIKDLTTVTLTEKDICVLITEFLEKNGLKPIKPVTSLNVGSRLAGFGMNEYQESYLDDTTIKCNKV